MITDTIWNRRNILTSQIRRFFGRLISDLCEVGPLFSAAREIDLALNGKSDKSSANPFALKQVTEDIYQKYGIGPQLHCQLERTQATMTQEHRINVDECLVLARAELNAAKAQLVRQISNYPGPIAGCDCQFNHLLATRTKIAAALAALDLDIRTPSPKRA